MKDADLNQTIDDQAWLREHPVYCPISWCTANKNRRARCGDKDGPYIGLHVARIGYVKTAQKIRERFVKRWGVETAWLMQIRQDAIDSGLAKGRKGRRNVGGR